MSSQTRKNSLVLGTTIGTAAGLVALTVILKRDKLTAKLKSLDQQLYEDGRIRANKISQIKHDINKQVKKQ